jgi:ribose 5-phosphate isomerase B
MKYIVAGDHAGLNLKNAVRDRLIERGFEVTDAGPETPESCDYSRYALVVARAVAKGEYERGVLICGTGIGMSMAANRIKGARAAVCATEFHARMGRAHNDANILCMGERVTGQGLAMSILDVFVDTEFEDGRHRRRIDIFDMVD